MAWGIGFGGEFIERDACGAEVGEGSGGLVVVFELLRHGADDGAEVVVGFVGGVGEAREDRTAQIIIGFVYAECGFLHFNAFHGRFDDKTLASSKGLSVYARRAKAKDLNRFRALFNYFYYYAGNIGLLGPVHRMDTQISFEVFLFVHPNYHSLHPFHYGKVNPE